MRCLVWWNTPEHQRVKMDMACEIVDRAIASSGEKEWVGICLEERNSEEIDHVLNEGLLTPVKRI